MDQQQDGLADVVFVCLDELNGCRMEEMVGK
jgi:hypothetical protein